MQWKVTHCRDETIAGLCVSSTLSPGCMHSHTYTAGYIPLHSLDLNAVQLISTLLSTWLIANAFLA